MRSSVDKKLNDLGKTLTDGLAEFGDLVRRDSNETIENVKKELKEEMKYSFCSIEQAMKKLS